MRVRDSEKRVRDLEEDNERLKQQMEVDNKEREHIQRVKIADLERRLKERGEEKDALVLQVAAAEDVQSYDKEKSREVRRLEGELQRLREREDAIEADLLASQNQVLRLRFESEAAQIKIQRWQRRVRELESLPLAVGKADKPTGKKGGKDEDEMERFVRTTKVAMEKLHRENESLREYLSISSCWCLRRFSSHAVHSRSLWQISSVLCFPAPVSVCPFVAPGLCGASSSA